LAEIREQGSAPEGSPSSGIGRVRAVEDELQRAITEAEGFDLITMGRPEGPRCYCAVNNLLRKSLNDLSNNYAAVVVDNEAGMEHLSRRTTNDVDFLLMVMTPTMPALRATQRIVALAAELPIRVGHRAVLVNRVDPRLPAEWLDREVTQLGVPRLPDIPQDDDVERAGAAGRNVFDLSDDNPALLALGHVIKTLRSTT
jgi:CO dehydrogenase maturation factor